MFEDLAKQWNTDVPTVIDTLNKAHDSLTQEFSQFNLDIDPQQFSSQIEPILDVVQEMKDLDLEDYVDDALSGNLETVFGNIDTNARQVLEWTDETLEKYSTFVEELNEAPEVGDISTVLGSWDTFGISDGNGGEFELSVAYSPLLQTDSGEPIPLDKDTVNEYIRTLMENSVKEVEVDGEIYTELDTALMLDLDSQGMQVGETFIHGLIAAIDENLEDGNEADIVSKLMHFSGEYGGLQPLIDDLRTVASELGLTDESIGLLISRIQELNT